MRDMSEESQNLNKGEIVGRKYRIEKVLGSGGFGITYKAFDNDLKCDVVIKENLPSTFAYRDSSNSVRPRTSIDEDRDNFEWSLTSFMKEAETLAKFDHEAIVRIKDFFKENGTAYFVMPYIEGESLDSVIKTGGQFSDPQIKSILESLLSALGSIHEKNIFHRDIKPANILMTQRGPILIDFGAARQKISKKSLTVIESVGYTPFEQLQSKGNVGAWSDLYGLAATFYKVITGKTPPKVNDRIRNDPYEDLTGNQSLSKKYSNSLLTTLDSAMSIEEEDRPQSANAMLQMLEIPETAEKKLPSAQSSSNPPVYNKKSLVLIGGVIFGLVCSLGSVTAFVLLQKNATIAKIEEQKQEVQSEALELREKQEELDSLIAQQKKEIVAQREGGPQLTENEESSEPENGVLYEYDSVKNLYLEHGYEVVNPKTEKVSKIVKSSSSVNVKGFVMYNGVTYYVSDYSWELYKQGKTPNFIYPYESSQGATSEPQLTYTGGSAGYVLDRNGVRVWNNKPMANESVVWSGSSSKGYAYGYGKLTWYKDGEFSVFYKGTMVNGKLEGKTESVDSMGNKRYRMWENGRKIK